jgi:hypothetical protein
MLSKNSASSRAIPFAKMKEQLTGRPVRFGQANPGMQDKGEDFDGLIEVETVDGRFGCFTAKQVWEMAKADALYYSEALYNAGFHKQVYNRLTEPFQMMKTVITATEWNNFFWLRNHGAADPTIAELARCMFEAREKSTPQLLKPGEWHLPYVVCGRDFDDTMKYTAGTGEPDDDSPHLTLEDAIKVSCARCAAVSFRNIDYGVEKSREVYERLVGDDRKHASAFEHTATPIPEGATLDTPGVTSMHKKMGLMSGNLRGWIQYRQLIDGNTFYGY